MFKPPVMLGPNITGQVDQMGLINSGNSTTGAFSKADSVGWSIYGRSVTSYELAFDASLCHTIFGKSSIVQPESIQLLACIKT